MSDMQQLRDPALVARVRAQMALVDRTTMLFLPDESDEPAETEDDLGVEPGPRGAISGG